jgi:hypothetical protein
MVAFEYAFSCCAFLSASLVDPSQSRQDIMKPLDLEIMGARVALYHCRDVP